MLITTHLRGRAVLRPASLPAGCRGPPPCGWWVLLGKAPLTWLYLQAPPHSLSLLSLHWVFIPPKWSCYHLPHEAIPHASSAEDNHKYLNTEKGVLGVSAITHRLRVTQSAARGPSPGSPAHLCGGECALSGSPRWKNSSCSTGTWRPWCPCAFWCGRSECSLPQRPGNTVGTWRASHGCECGCDEPGHWASGTPWCSRGTRAIGRHSPRGLSLEQN